MKEKTIFLVRHAVTDLNEKNLLQGKRVDYSINTFGLLQSEMFFEKYKYIPFDKIYTSTLKRSFESVIKFIKEGIPYESYKEINEIDYGIYDGIKSSVEKDGIYTEIVAKWNNGDLDSKLPKGESPNEVRNRLKFFLDVILERSEENIILISMHGRALRIMLTILLDQELTAMKHFSHSNMCLYILKINNHSTNVEIFNDTSHLNGIDNITKKV